MLTITDITDRLRCSREAVESWINSGELVASNVAPTGSRKRRYRVSEVELGRFLSARAGVGVSVPAATVGRDYLTPCLSKKSR